MFTLAISGMAWVAIVIGALIVIVFVAGIIRKFFPEKPRKPLKKI